MSLVYMTGFFLLTQRMVINVMLDKPDMSW